MTEMVRSTRSLGGNATRRLALVPLLGSLLAPNLFAAHTVGLNFIVQVLPLSNLVYQLDCLAGTINCSQATYLNLWKTRIGWTAEDDVHLDRWRALRRKYRGEIVLDVSRAEPMALPWSGPTGIELEDKFAIATFHARDELALRSHWEAIVAPTDLPALESVIDHFQPRFSKWWKEEAQGPCEHYRRTVQSRLAQKSVKDAILSFARFYDVDLPGEYPIYLNLFYRPKGTDNHTKGTQLENHAVVEFLPDEDVNFRLGVVIHELCHFFHASGSEADKRALSQSFADSPDSLSLAGLNILNEALATALGNGIAGELLLDPATFKAKLESDRGLYNDSAIDAAAKAILPFLKSQLATGKTLYDQAFAASYLSALEHRMGPLLQMPARLLTELVIIHDTAFSDVVNNPIRRRLSGGIYPSAGVANDASWTMLKLYHKMNAMIVVSPATLPLLADRTTWVSPNDLDVMKRQFDRSSSWVYAIQRFPSTYVFVIGGKSGDDVVNAFQSLLNAKTRFTGFFAN